MSAKLNVTAIAATLSILALAMPASAADAAPGYHDSAENVEIIRANGRQDGGHGRRGGHRDDYHDNYRDNYRDDYHARGHRDERRRGHRPVYGFHHDHLRPWEVRRKLHRRGFHHIHFVDRRAPVYKLRATGPRGRRVFLVVSSRTGRIIDRRPLRPRYWR